MTPEEEQREKLIQKIADFLRERPFSFEFKVKKKPQGIKIIYEVTQEHLQLMMDARIKEINNKHKL